MTAHQHIAIANVHAKLEAHRERVEQTRREPLSKEDQAKSLWYALEAARDEGDLTKARRLAIELKPLLMYLPEEV